MAKYKSYMQEYLRTYDNPLNENISKTIISYLKFYNYIPVKKTQRFINRSYKAIFTNGTNIAVLNFGSKFATLIEYEGTTENFPIKKIDFLKQEILEYIGTTRDRCIIYTCDKYRKCYYYGPLNYQNMKDYDYYNNRISDGTMPDSVKDHSIFKPIMMRIVASGEFANEIRCIRANEEVYCGKQLKKLIPKQSI